MSHQMRIETVETTLIGPPGVPPAKGIGRECVTPLSGLDFADDEMRSGLPPADVWAVLVSVKTSDGQLGIGSAGFGNRVAASVIESSLAPLLIGRDPFDVEALWRLMYLSTLNFGRKGAVLAAISAVDIALWDLIGKILDEPVFRLIGGRTKPAIRVYASRLYATEDLDALTEEARSYVDAGFTAVKQRLAYGPRDGKIGMERNLELVQTIAEALPRNVEHMVDAYMGWDSWYATRMIRMIERAGIDLAWIEEPLPPDNVAAYAELRRNVDTPIAAGEHEYTRYGVHDLLIHKAVDVLQTDMNRTGGITEAKKIVALASSFDVPVIPHAGQLHNYHVVMSSPGCPMAEHFIRPPVGVVPDEDELFYRLFTGEPDAVDGYVQLADGIPGMGYDLNLEAIDAWRVSR
jgi:L-rhamnonate dehydratase